MKQIIKQLLAVAILLFSTLSTWAYDFEDGSIYYGKNSDGTTVYVTYETTSYNSYSGSVVIPSTVTYSGTTYSVTSIGKWAFNGCSGLTSVTIPNSVTSIGNSAFSGCSGLKQLTIQDGTSTLSLGYNLESSSSSSAGEGLFYDAPLESVYLGRNLTYESWFTYGYSPFYGKKTIKELTIGNSVTKIGYDAFRNCSGLTTMTIGNSVTSIGEDAFYNCSGLTSVTIPNSVTSIGNWAFFNCSGLTSVTIGNSVTSIGEFAFYNCSGLTSVTIPNSVTSIGRCAFERCSGLTSVTIGNSVTSIGDFAFNNCSGLKQLTIQDGTSTLSLGYNFESFSSVGGGLFYDAPLESVYLGRNLSYDTSKNRGYSPFYYKSTIKELTIGNSVTSISDNLFCGCNGLTSLTIGNSISSISKGVFDFTSLKQLTIQDGSSTLSMGYNSASIWSTETGKGLFYDAPLEIIYLGRNLTYESSSKYGYSPFYGLSTIKELTIGNSVTSIGVNLFGGCSGLTSVTIGNSVTKIGYDAFYNCSGLTSVIYNAENCTTKSSIFSSCTNLTSLTIGDKVKSIPSSIFADCSGLTSVIIPNSVTSIGSSAFSGCSGLKSVTIPYSVNSIGGAAFNNCSGLTSVIYNAENCTTKSSIFSSCTNLTSLTIGDKVKSIPSSIFADCSGLTSVTIPNSVTSIGNSAFSGCSGLKQLTIQDGTSTLSLGYNLESSSSSSAGEGLFYDAPLESVYLGRNLTYESWFTYGYSPFYGKKTIKELTIGNSVTKIGYDAFRNCSGLTTMTIGNSVTSIGDDAFLDCSGLTSVTIPNSVTSIGRCAFERCSGLTSVTIGNSVTSIGDFAFNNCSGLTSVKIGNSVSSIGASAFYGCDNLEMVIFNATNSNSCAFSSSKDLTFIVGEAVVSIPNNIVYNRGSDGVSKVIALADTPPTATSETFDSSVTSSATLYVKKNTVYKYFMADGWSDFANINTIDNLVTNISLDKTSVNLSLGETCKLNAIVEPAGATLTDLFWTASNSCVSVDQDGNVTGLSDGQCVVTAEAIDGTGIKAQCVVNVGNIYAQSLRLSQETLALEVNGMAKLSCTILPGDTTIKTVEWSCSNESVATFNENADNTITVVGVESGVATITALTTDGSNLAALCTVYVGVTGAEFIDSDAVKVTSKGGAIRISGAAGAVAEVYSLSGMLLYCGTDSTIALPRGVYIVKVAGTTTKVIL